MEILKSNCLGLPVFTGSLHDINYDKKSLISTVNQYSYCMAVGNSSFKKALIESDILLPDGIGVVVAHKWLTGQRINKIAGADLHFHLLEKLNKEKGKCFYLGSSEGTLNKIKKRLAEEYPNITVGFYSPPYKPQFSDLDNASMIEVVNKFKPDVLFVGMTAPKQEKWAHAHKEKLDAQIICSIGAVFDFYAGTVERPNEIWIGLGLEWLGRLVKEPKRMWKRYLYYGPVFAYYVLKEKIQQFS